MLRAVVPHLKDCDRGVFATCCSVREQEDGACEIVTQGHRRYCDEVVMVAIVSVKTGVQDLDGA